MADKMIVDMNVCPDNTGLNDQDQGTRQAHRTSTTIREGILVDVSDTKRQKKQAMQEDAAEISFQMTGESPRKASRFSTLIGLLPMGHGSQQQAQDMKENDAQRAIKVLQNDVEKLRKEKTAAETEITKLNAELSSISGRYKEDVRRAREALTKMESQNNSFRENNRRLEEAWKNADARSKYSASRFNQLSQQLANVSRQLMEEKSNSGQKLAQLHFQNKTLHDKNRTLNDMNKNLHDKNDTLRQMVVPVSEKQVLDADVQQKFTALRSSIVGLVRQTWIPALKHDFDSLGMSVLQGDLITTEFPMTYERLRCMVFFFINAGIFDTRSYFLGHPFENLEQLVRRVEKELNQYSPRENEKLIAEWRNATFKATEIFRDNGRRLSSAMQEEIWDFFSPFQTKTSDAGQNGRKKLKATCDNAVELGLMIRQMKDNFIVDDLEGAVGKPLSEWEEFAEEVESVVVDRRHEPGTIAYVIAGALIKNPKENPEKVLVLEKAEVAVYRQETSNDW